MNYYELLNIPISPIPDVALAKKHFLQLSKQFHPDRYGTATEAEQQYALTKSTEINQAFRSLSKSDTALNYYLELNAIIAPGEEYKLAPDFLMDMMEQNEALEFANTEEKITLQQNIENQKQELLAQIHASLEIDPKPVAQIKESYYKLKYYQRLLT